MAPKAEKKPAKKVAKKATTGGKKKAKAKVETFKIYIYKVLKQVGGAAVLERLNVCISAWGCCDAGPACLCALHTACTSAAGSVIFVAPLLSLLPTPSTASLRPPL